MKKIAALFNEKVKPAVIKAFGTYPLACSIGTVCGLAMLVVGIGMPGAGPVSIAVAVALTSTVTGMIGLTGDLMVDTNLLSRSQKK